ncbi:histidine ammonia-lyase [Psychroserpens sp.]|uniref:histidine ammonia-lyase n=1 Tax=Psychroserpens sp. TaxID=2020870 RepID=UPI001B20C0FB|nr:histidine ammonia-lyase [Psychroserpens sp.]MBO6607092.1 histidine ammonia-lyase [Psychroserpens sp.]MBO6654238.1 histidine ammonia-lyase [Psychroserpens sp.]MBO6682476.1 histidine ammonia-lyase [Psychroserpens sp.]MBO6750864.1 histidine ammonia-lyase [Psychroserpens sp.]MBO6915707.1 histidine ammonia-lyase [Psychroserpens sp.]
MNSIHYISSEILNLSVINDIVIYNKRLELSDQATANIRSCRSYLDDKISKQNQPIYGINTGFGSLCDVKISNENLTHLQENLVMSHACGIGDKVPNKIVKIMLLLKIQSLSYGHSGVQLETVQRLIDFYNNDVIPIVYTQGSLGASGDLAPLAHMALPLIAKGEVFHEGEQKSSAEVLKHFKWEAIKLASKEGLALLNGTQFMSAYGIYTLIKSYKLSYFADLISSISLDAFNGRLDPFNELVHLVRPHRGQLKIAKRVRGFLEGSELIDSHKEHVQDPYSFRCIPQVHGASWDTIKFVNKTFNTEINSVTDNPNIFVGEDEIISGGNFHGQPLALGLDYLKIAISELGNISERRTYQLVSGLRGLPAFLVDNPGLNSGFMIPQYTAASIVSANKQLASPASVDSIVSSNGQEDHVSMGANAAVQCYDLINNVERILAIELLNASQALEFRKPKKSSPLIESFLKSYRETIPFVKEDLVFYNLIQDTLHFIDDFYIENELLFD